MSRHAVAAGDAAVPAVDYSAAFPFRSPTYCGERTQHAYAAWPRRKTALSSSPCPDTFTEIYDARSVMASERVLAMLLNTWRNCASKSPASELPSSADAPVCPTTQTIV
jgi:hypothetical protein